MLTLYGSRLTSSKTWHFFKHFQALYLASVNAPPPWQLTGRGLIVLFRFPKSFENRFPNSIYDSNTIFRGGFGCFMLVDYDNSPVGPYGEILFIPGRFTFPNGKTNWSISHIHVTSDDSTEWGNKNWAIPKVTSKITRTKDDHGIIRTTGNYQGDQYFDATIKPYGPRFPITTALLPISLVQPRENELIRTSIKGNGTGRLASVKSIETFGDQFPSIEGIKPLLAVSVDPFKLTFPTPQITQIK